MPLPVTFANLPTGNNPASLLDQEFAAVAAMGTTYCTATGTNAILLTVAPNQPIPTGYANGQQFSFLAPAANTGPVTIQVGSLAAIPLRASGAALNAGALVAGTSCDVVISGNGTTADLVSGGGPIHGTSTNDSAPAGFVGEYISSVIAAPGTTLTSGASANITSISLTAGDWDVGGEVWFAVGTGGATQLQGGINSVSTTLPNAGAGPRQSLALAFTASFNNNVSLAPMRFSLAATTTIYLIAQAFFASGTTTAWGRIGARRAR